MGFMPFFLRRHLHVLGHSFLIFDCYLMPRAGEASVLVAIALLRLRHGAIDAARAAAQDAFRIFRSHLGNRAGEANTLWSVRRPIRVSALLACSPWEKRASASLRGD